MKYPAYPKYKDSGVAWLGEVPEHWEVKKIKYIARLESGHTPDKQKEEYWTDCDIPWVSLNDSKRLASSDYINETTFQINRKGLENSSARILPARAVVFTRDATIGLAAIICRDMAVSQHIIAWICRLEVVVPELLLLAIYAMQTYLDSFTFGSTIKTIGLPDIKKLCVPVPSIAEQERIVQIVFNNNAKLDTLIAKKRELIDKLKEKRAALITRTVTRGLPPDAATAAGLDPHPKMKDSGVEWLGEVPEHWEVKRLKHIAKLQTGITLGKDRHNKHTVSVPYLRVANVQDGYIDISDVSEIEIEAHEIQNYALRKGDVLMNEGGDNDKLGRGAVWSGDISPCIHQNHVFCFRPFGVIPEFLSLYVQSLCAKYYLFLSSRQSTNLASISSRNIIELHIPVPPRPEQELILGYLADQFAQIDTTTRLAEETIAKLLEYRAALIAAAVTGRIDVRNFPTEAA